MVLRPFEDFWDKVAPALLPMLAPPKSRPALTEEDMRHALQSMVGLNDPLGSLLETLYGIAEWMIEIKNELALQSASIPDIRRLAKVCDSGVKSVRKSKDCLSTASLSSLKRVIPEFAQVFDTLERIESQLLKLRNSAASMVPPKERTPKERRLATQSPYELAAFTKSPAALDHAVVYLIERELTTFTRIDIRSHLIDQFIFQFLYFANNRDVERASRKPPSPGNVKQMRHRLRTGEKQVPKWLSVQFPPASYKKRSISHKNKPNA